MCWLGSKIRVVVRHPSAEPVTSHGEEGTIQANHGFGPPDELGAWAGVAMFRVWERWEDVHGGAGVLQAPAELFRDTRKAIFENLVWNQKVTAGKDTC